SSLAVPGSLATPWVDQLVFKTQKAEPQDACAIPAPSSVATAPASERIAVFMVFPPCRFESNAHHERTPTAAFAQVRYHVTVVSGVKRRRARLRVGVEVYSLRRQRPGFQPAGARLGQALPDRSHYSSTSMHRPNRFPAQCRRALRSQ